VRNLRENDARKAVGAAIPLDTAMLSLASFRAEQTELYTSVNQTLIAAEYKIISYKLLLFGIPATLDSISAL
jgi:hypothetical protein